MGSEELTTFLRTLGEEYLDYAEKLHDAQYTRVSELRAVNREDLEALKIPVPKAANIIQTAKGSGTNKITVTLIKAKAPGNETKQVLFDSCPTFLRLGEAVESAFPEYQDEDYILKAGQVHLSKDQWATFIPGKTKITVAVIAVSKAFSAIKAEEGYQLLGLTKRKVKRADEHFPAASYNPMAQLSPEVQRSTSLKTSDDLLEHMAVDLALRCLQTHPAEATKEYTRRDLISPLVFAASCLAGDVVVHSEYTARGTRARGQIDWVIEFKEFIIVVVEGKFHTQLPEHIGQLCAEIKSVREQYTRVELNKRKHDDITELHEVPSFGVLSNGLDYIFYKYDPQQASLVRSKWHSVSLKLDTTAKEAKDMALPVVRVLLQLIHDQKRAMDAFENKRLRLEGS